MDLGKIFGAVKLPLIIAVVLGLISTGISFVVYSSAASNPSALLSSPLFAVSGLLGLAGLLVYVWAGFKVVAEKVGGLAEAAVGGAIIAVIAGLINGVLNMVLIVPMMSSLGAYGAAAGAVAGAIGIVGLIVGIPIGAIVGGIISLIGGAIKIYVMK